MSKAYADIRQDCRKVYIRRVSFYVKCRSTGRKVLNSNQEVQFFMSLRLASLMIISLFSVALLAAPVLGFSVSVYTGDGSGVASSSGIYSLDDSTSLKEEITAKGNDLQKSLQASGAGKNEISQQMTSGSSSLQSSMSSEGSLDISSSGYASSGSASLGVGVAAQGDLSLSGQASRGQAESGQEVGVVGGQVSTSLSLSGGEEATSSQSTQMAGVAGYIGSQAFSQQNTMVATGSFLGDGLLVADLGATAAEKAATSGQASLNGVTYLSDSTFQQISSESMGIGIMGLRQVGNRIGSFDMKVSNRQSADDLSYGEAAAVPSGGYTSSYELTKDPDTGRNLKWTQNDPQIQLYYNPNNVPSGLTSTEASGAIAAAANTWDNTVAQNLFIDTNTVKVDSSKVVDNPYSSTPETDGYNVNAWWALSGDTLGLSRYWYNPGSVVDGYESLIESDVWYNKDKSWTTDWNTAVSTAKIDLQSVATHELGHSIGMGDIYYPVLPSTDPRTKDYEQVMNLYDAPQRTLGNGDRTGVQTLYGVPVWGNIALRAYNGQYVCAEGGGGRELIANRDWVREWETFGLIDLGNNNVALRAYNGQYVCAEWGGGRELIDNRDWVREWETFGQVIQ
jgi:hypothetical protein